MCTDCDAKEYELYHLHKECARLITENHFLNKRVDGLLADNNALRAANSGLHRMVVRLQIQIGDGRGEPCVHPSMDERAHA